MNKKILVLGGKGGLGEKLCPLFNLPTENNIIVATNSSDVNIHNDAEVKEFLEKGEFEVIINMASRNHDGQIHKYGVEEVNEQIDTNIIGNNNVLRFAIPGMRERGYGRIIYMSSILSKKPVFGTGIYGATKAFNDHLIKTAALENAKYGITVNSIQAGYFDGGMAERIPKEIMEKIVKTIPLKRVGQIQELYNTMKFLIETEYITGVNLPIAGGLEI